MDFDNELGLSILLPAASFFFIYYLFYRKYIFSLLDPLFLFVFNLSFSSVLVINIVEDPQYIIHFFICQFCLFIGFATVQKFVVVNRKPEPNSFIFYDISLLKTTVYVALAIYVIANLIVFSTKGSALFADRPDTAKVTNFQEGFGVFRKINWGIGSFLCASITTLYLLEVKRIYIYLILIVAFFTALEGSKSSLLRIIIIGVLLVNHPFFAEKRKAINTLKKFAPVGLAALVIVLYMVLSKNNSNFSVAFIQRLLFGADALLYFYQPENEYFLTQYGFVDYLHHVTNPVMAFLRLATYDEAIGNIIVENTVPPGVTPDTIVGPNTPFYTEGQIYFGYYGAFLYSICIGAIYSYIRQLFFSLKQGSLFFFSLACALCFHGANILIDSTLFITFCFDTCFFVIPIYVLVCFASKGKILLRPVRFNLFNKPILPPLE